MQQFLGNRYPNDGNRANVPNVGTLPARVSCFFNLFARNLTLAPLSNWVTVLLPVGGASFVPIADGGDLEDLTFVGSTYSVKAVIQFTTSYVRIYSKQFSNSRRPPRAGYLI